MRSFLIKENGCDSSEKEYAVLSYDEEKDVYHVSIPASVNPDNLPAILGILARKGIREIEDRWARQFVKERVVPPDRQNIGMILRDAGLGIIVNLRCWCTHPDAVQWMSFLLRKSEFWVKREV